MLSSQTVRSVVCATALLSISVASGVTARSAVHPSWAAQAGADAITQLAIERRCGGCVRELSIRIDAGGSAVKTVLGNARMGTVDHRFAGESTPAAFHDVAVVAAAANFFDLRDEYRADSTADGETLTTTAIAGGRSKSVLDANKAGPAALRRLESAMLAFDQSVTWKEIR